MAMSSKKVEDLVVPILHELVTTKFLILHMDIIPCKGRQEIGEVLLQYCENVFAY